MKENDYVIAKGRIGVVRLIEEDKCLIQYGDVRTAVFMRWVTVNEIQDIPTDDQLKLKKIDTAISKMKKKRLKIIDSLDPSLDSPELQRVS